MANDAPNEPAAKRIAITGSSGLIGQALRSYFGDAGYTIHRVRRSQPDNPQNIYWQPRGGEIEADKLEGVDVVVHLAGENLFGRWTDAKKESIMESRRQGTRLVAETLAGLDNPPDVFVSASAVGYYGDTGPEVVDESSAPGHTFLAEVCEEWEAASRPAVDAGIRTVNPRLGVVLSTEDGALQKMLTPFKLGLGGRIGSGDQYMSWIALDDVVRAIAFLVDNDELTGPVNVTAPHPVTNKEFTDTLGDVLHRPTIFPLPKAIVKLGGGEMGQEMLLNGQRAVPTRLNESGFEFAYPELEAALRHELS
ncbi:TIGR01777 family protein [Persicimonas caeni]|uniref:TIGR01777 family protein n=1 Tax=Persicimonas caeni TaxID=2292766 RepID=A0A4Y6PY93_PERCE|nr:TIGR01777 family oxidoreductase [Persicimonas caeni]QDG53298.1 TIGR01777 family protein [Persicimonas caeni]QED34520.1 TIGR01777 family protein [Persicimonas caeni]